MKFNKHIFGIFLFTILAISCSNTSAEEGAVTAAAGGKEKPKMKEISIKGNIENGADKQLYLQYLKVKAADNLDTITIDKNGDYEFEFTPENQGFYRVMLNEQNLFVVVVTGQEDVVVNANAENMYSSYKVEKSEETARLL
ncbi:MAG: DUF4369 domain-containing protein, partial [Salibacteraceae bacterium]|nr:DUF4369 domain-containing protein [Salibacteraceae bacterium]MDP4686645.1 DUF4369 domain-containing protein [Salibacteraceae bacterium]MDP4965365.1 DUF4369 domain-containing protein [Salibacteraceae bacterium]